MKRAATAIFLLSVISPVCLHAVPQDSETGGDALRPPESLAAVVAEPSPDVSAMLRHLDEEVSHANGEALLTVPLYEWDSGDIHTALTLRYRVGGYRMEDRAGWTGLGWDLTGTGCVARTIVGMPDERQTFDIRSASRIDSDPDGHEYFLDLEKHIKDASLDLYSYTCAAGTGSFLIVDGNIVQTPRSNNRIEFTGNLKDGVGDFLITSPDGTRYFFTEREYIDFASPCTLEKPTRDDGYLNAVSVWRLSSVTSAGGETVSFGYDTLPDWHRMERHPSGTYTIVNRSQEYPRTVTSYDSSTSSDGGGAASLTTFRGQKVFERITSRTATVEFASTPLHISGEDDFPVLLGSIRVLAPSGKCVRDITLRMHSPVGAPSMLTGVEIKSGDVLLDSHSFSYRIPSSSLGEDLFGYGSSHASYVRAVVDYATGKPGTGIAFDPANADARTLRTHANALGLVTEYEFEPGASVTLTTYKGQPGFTAEIPIGVRLKKITDRDDVTGRRRVREFLYSSPQCDIDFTEVDASAFVVLSGETRHVPVSLTSQSTNRSTSVSFLSRARLSGFPVDRAAMRYGEVTELVSGTGIPTPVRTVRGYDLSPCRLRFVTVQQPRESMDADRYVRSIMYLPEGVPEGVRLAIGAGHRMPGGFERRHGAAPLLTEKIDCEYRDGVYVPLTAEKYFYCTVDSATLQTGVHYEATVRDVLNIYGVRKWDWQSTSDFSFCETRLTCFNTQLDSVAVTRHFPGGHTRTETLKHVYSVPSAQLFPLQPLRVLGGNLGDLPVISPEARVPNPFCGDSITMGNTMRLHMGTRLKSGMRTFERYTAYSSNMKPTGYAAVKSAGQNTLPVVEIWVVDGRDTIVRKTAYAKHGTAWRPSSVELSLSDKVIDWQEVTGYTAYGKPTVVRQLGKPETSYAWGDTPATADLLQSMTIGEGEMSLTTSYTHEPLVGCTSVIVPDGSTVSYGYEGGRLVSESNPEGIVIRKHGYGLHAETSGEDGRNYVTKMSRVTGTGSFSEVSTYHDGFGYPCLEVSVGCGSGGDVARAWTYDALHRTLKEWNPLPLESSIAEALASDSPLESASTTLHSDAAAYRGMTYPVSTEGTPASVTLPGSDFRQHPQTAVRRCSESASGEYRVIRYSCDGTSLKSSGVYAAGELDCTEVVDGNGHRTLTFTDIFGNETLVRREMSAGRFADIYTVRDSWGKPLVILPPEASTRLNSVSGSWPLSSTAAINDYAFLYTYDGVMRLRSEKVPGCAPVTYARDVAGREVFMRDGNLLGVGRARFTLRDALGRVAVTGTCLYRPVLWQAGSLPAWTATRTGRAGTGFLGTGYTIPVQAGVFLQSSSLLEACYYDNTEFLPPGFTAMDGDTEVQDNTGLHTGVLSAALDGCGVESGRKRYAPGGVMTSSESLYPDGWRHLTTIVPTASGLPASVTEHVRKGSTGRAGITHFAYDPFGRVTSVSLGVDGSELRRPLVSYSFGATGEVCRETYGMSGPARSVTRDIRGAVSSWSMGGFSQSLTYGAGASASAPADWCGRVTAKDTRMGDYAARYLYSYTPQGFLSKAAYSSSTDPDMDFSTSYTHDLNGNLTHIVRKGMLVNLGMGYGTCADIGLTLDGNRVTAVSVSDVDGNALEGQPQVRDSGDGFTYDAAGNLTRDPSRGIENIEWSVISRPLRVTFETGEEIVYRYAGTGEKLSEEYLDADGAVLRRRDYIGGFEFVDGKFSRQQVEGGYLTSGRRYHAYVNDYQGNVLGVIDTDIGEAEQYTDYYPYGLPHATAHAPEVSRRKFGGKEYTTEFGFNSCDFGARLHSPLHGSFISSDPKAKDYPHLSPYSYCASDPVNFIDPTGEDIAVLLHDEGGLKQHLAMLIQNPNGKWSYYSVNGNNVYVSGEFWGGRKKNDVGVGSWNSPREFMKSDYNRRQRQSDSYNDVCNYNFRQCYIIKTSSEQDKKMIEDFKKVSKMEYNLLTNNCATAVQRVMYNSGVNVSNPPYWTVTNDTYMLNGQPIYDFRIPNFTPLPRNAFESIMETNPDGEHILREKKSRK